MERLTTDNPQGNLQNAHNLFYVKDYMTWVRGGGEPPDFKDIPLNDFIRRIINEFSLDYDLSCDNEELMEQLHERLFDGAETMEGVVATLNAAAWAFSELRAKLKEYEDAEEQGLLVRLPRRVGDTAFVLETENETGGKFRLFEGAIVAFQFTNEQIIVSIGDTGRDCWFSEADRQLSDIGHEWFLTREEAEAASEEANRNGG